MTIKVKLTGERNAAFYSVAVGSVVELELDEYLRGVVAAEIGNASLEACKAQAVASRTTAYPYYSTGKVISDSSRSAQCFNAERAYSTKYPNAFQAVSETADEVLKYDGKVIVPCSFSSSNGGRTASSQERWGGARAWLIAQKDEWDDAATHGRKTGHGVGMSQTGAKYAAAIGKSYTEILSFYYPNTTLQKGVDRMAYATVKASYLVAKFKLMALPWCSPKKPWKYVAGGASEGAVDCSGAFTYWYGKAGSFMYHGSNTMWRKYTTAKGKIGDIDLVPGMAVFKMRQDGKEPDQYKGDGLGNFYHTGCYIGDGKVIEAQSVKTGVVTSCISSWGYAARMKYTEYDLSEGGEYPATGTVVTAGGHLNMRSEPGRSGAILARIPNGTALTLTGKNGDWYAATYAGRSGYVSAQYISLSGGIYLLSGKTSSAEAKDKLVAYAKELSVTLTVTGGDD